MNIHSLFFRLNLFFILAILLLGMLYVYVKQTQRSDLHRQITHRSMELGRMIRHVHMQGARGWREMAEEAEFNWIESGLLPASAKPVTLREGMLPPMRPIRIFVDGNGQYYYLFHRGPVELLFADDRQYSITQASTILFVVLFFGLLLLYGTMRKSLLPLKRLTRQIRRFADGEKDVDTFSGGRDEIALISNEFNDAVSKIRRLESTRQLFWRNIMHELKTPLTKGKLALAMLEENRDTAYLNRVFDRMDELINQMAAMERVDHTEPTKQVMPLHDIVDKAIDRLYLKDEGSIAVSIPHDIKILVDPELFGSALSNLIDNAVKYATLLPVTITAGNGKICIINEGEPMQNSFESNKSAFIAEHTKSGLGLGLHIADTILTRHGFQLTYDYDQNKHIMCIYFTKDSDQ